MNLKSYMRGIGIGMIVAAGTLHFTFAKSNNGMTDEQVRARAMELGMIENTVLSSATLSNNSASVSAQDSVVLDADEIISDGQSVSGDIITIDIEDSVSGNEQTEVVTDSLPESEPEPNTEPDTPSIDESVNYVTITVVSGDSSYSVAKKVVEAGLAQSAAAFDQFLCAGGYDKILTVGSHRIPEDATDEEIAKLLTSRAN